MQSNLKAAYSAPAHSEDEFRVEAWIAHAGHVREQLEKEILKLKEAIILPAIPRPNPVFCLAFIPVSACMLPNVSAE